MVCKKLPLIVNQLDKAATLEKVSGKYSRIIRAMPLLHCGKMKKQFWMGLDPNLLCHGDDDSVSDYFDGSFQTDRMIKGHGILWLCPIGPVTHRTDERKMRPVLPAHVFFETQCSTAPEFAEVAKHLNTKPCGSGTAERDHKDTKTIWTKHAIIGCRKGC